ncbi:hypothetical protein F4861DRAFT_413448 [Xylaria intraflava]|nr:hypothetical protein F4861DRAFT_413448 [Xylaria intraflava]
MNHIRMSLFGRGQTQEHGLPQTNHPRSVDVERQRYNGPRLSVISRSALPGFLAGRASLGTRGWRVDDDNPQGGPTKSSSPNSFRPPRLARSRTEDITNQSSSGDGMRAGESPSRPSTTSTRAQAFPVLTRPAAARIHGETERHVRRARFNGGGMVELFLPGSAESGRQAQHGHQRQANSDRSRRHRHKDRPQKFMFCFPWVQSRQARSLILRCFVSGIFVVATLSIFLSLSLTKNIRAGEFGILLILLIALTTIFFCHSLVRLCSLLARPQSRAGSSGNGTGSNRNGPSGYTIPQRPIRVILPGDVEAAGMESEAAQVKPPAYGQWRESVRVDPSRLYWQRAEPPSPPRPTSALSTNQDTAERGVTRIAQHRPPSYASGDGVDYVLDARPRSIAPPPSSAYSQASVIETPTLHPCSGASDAV